MRKERFYIGIKRLPIGFLIGLVLFIFGQVLLIKSPSFWKVGLRYSRPTWDSCFRYEATIKLMPNKTENKRIIFFGPSVINEAVDADYLNKAFPSKDVRFYKLSLPWFYPADMFQLKQELIEKKPDMIIIMLNPGTFYAPYKGYWFFGTYWRYHILWQWTFNPVIMPYLMKHMGAQEIIRERKVIFYALIKRCLFAYRYRNTLRYFVETLINELPTEKKVDFKEYYWKFNAMSESWFKKITAKFSKERRFEISKLSDFQEFMFTELIKFFNNQDIDVMIMDIPCNPLIKKTYNRKIDDAYLYFLKEQSEKLGYILITQEELPLLEKKDYFDFVHPNKYGREKISKFIKKYFLNSPNLIF